MFTKGFFKSIETTIRSTPHIDESAADLEENKYWPTLLLYSYVSEVGGTQDHIILGLKKILGFEHYSEVFSFQS